MEFLRKFSFLDSDTDPSPPSFLNMIGWLGLQQSACNYKNKSNCIRDTNSDITEPVKLPTSILLVYEKNMLVLNVTTVKFSIICHQKIQVPN